MANAMAKGRPSANHVLCVAAVVRSGDPGVVGKGSCSLRCRSGGSADDTLLAALDGDSPAATSRACTRDAAAAAALSGFAGVSAYHAVSQRKGG
jgi:hypothetical protein